MLYQLERELVNGNQNVLHSSAPNCWIYTPIYLPRKNLPSEKKNSVNSLNAAPEKWSIRNIRTPSTLHLLQHGFPSMGDSPPQTSPIISTDFEFWMVIYRPLTEEHLRSEAHINAVSFQDAFEP